MLVPRWLQVIGLQNSHDTPASTRESIGRHEGLECFGIESVSTLGSIYTPETETNLHRFSDCFGFKNRRSEAYQDKALFVVEAESIRVKIWCII